MSSIMAEVIRMDTRKRLREATCITLSVDDSKRRKLIHYQCDLQLLSVFVLGRVARDILSFKDLNSGSF